MPANFPGPYEVRVNYTAVPASGLKPHQFRFSVDLTTTPPPGTDFDSLVANEKGGSTSNLLSWVEGFVTLIAQVFSTTANFALCELWEYEPGTFNATWISSTVLDIDGLSASGTVEDSQTIMSFRSDNGGFGKIDLRNTIFNPVITAAYPSGNTASDNIMSYASGVGTIIKARDDGFFVSPYRLLRGVNEKMFKKRLRP